MQAPAQPGHGPRAPPPPPEDRPPTPTGAHPEAPGKGHWGKGRQRQSGGGASSGWRWRPGGLGGSPGRARSPCPAQRCSLPLGLASLGRVEGTVSWGWCPDRWHQQELGGQVVVGRRGQGPQGEGWWESARLQGRGPLTRREAWAAAPASLLPPGQTSPNLRWGTARRAPPQGPSEGPSGTQLTHFSQVRDRAVSSQPCQRLLEGGSSWGPQDGFPGGPPPTGRCGPGVWARRVLEEPVVPRLRGYGRDFQGTRRGPRAVD